MSDSASRDGRNVGANVDMGRVAQARRYLVQQDEAHALAEVFGALADPTRARLISALSGMELCVGELSLALGMSISAISHQLGLLRRLRAVKYRREGRRVYYSLDDEHISEMYHCGLDHVRHR